MIDVLARKRLLENQIWADRRKDTACLICSLQPERCEQI